MLHKDFINRINKMTEKSYKLFKSEIDFFDLRNIHNHIDHHFSKFDSFGYLKCTGDMGILKLVCHPANLGLMPARVNFKKSNISGFDLPELKLRIEKFDKDHENDPNLEKLYTYFDKVMSAPLKVKKIKPPLIEPVGTSRGVSLADMDFSDILNPPVEEKEDEFTFKNKDDPKFLEFLTKNFNSAH